MAVLRRLSDGVGESGARVECIAWNKDKTFKKIIGTRPVVGCSILVGSMSARSYSEQDFWLTSVITEIIEEKENYVKFKTQNSIYELKY